MKGRNGYTAPAIPEQVNGHWYSSKLEARMAKLLIRNGVKFTPHVTFQCFDPKGKPFMYEVDFVFETPQKFAGIPYTLDCLEVKGVMSLHAIKRNRAIKYCHDMTCWCVGYELIDMWERESLRWQR